jgi:hypothetical protein
MTQFHTLTQDIQNSYFLLHQLAENDIAFNIGRIITYVQVEVKGI